MEILTTIIPIFILIILGWAAKEHGFMPPEFLGPANRLVYYLAIPALIFRSISRTGFQAQFNGYVLIITLLSIIFVFVVSWSGGVIFHIPRARLGTFIQTSIHGNLGYIAFAVTYYFMGSEGLGRASIIAGFVMILQNLIAVIALQVNSEEVSSNKDLYTTIKGVLGNPVIISAMAGIISSLGSIPIPFVIGRSLDILSSLALPMALLIIGASLSFDLIRSRMFSIFAAAMLKLVLLPVLGFVGFRIFNISVADYLPGLIILASPTATVTYMIAKEMNGDPSFAVGSISCSTLLSALTMGIWLLIAG